VFGTKKRKVLIWSAIINLIILTSCGEVSSNDNSFYEIHGETQGTTYTVILDDESQSIQKKDLDSIFQTFDLSLSTYVKSSVISRLNFSKDSIVLVDKTRLFKRCYLESQRVYTLTNGVFDPSVFPLVKGWGFMTHIDSPLTNNEVDSILNFVSFKENDLHSVQFVGDTILFHKKNPGFMIDFNAIAQGLSVDIVDEYLKEKGFQNYYIEIGGELLVRGHNREGINWRIGIDTPKEKLESREIENVLSVSNTAIATSGNYRKFYVKDGVKYSHTLDPVSGFPVRHSLLSATVIAPDCQSADAYATAFMVMGKDKALEFVKNHPSLNLEIYLLYADEEGEIQRLMSDGFSKYIAEE